MTNKFREIKGSLGFGCMRLPMLGEEVDEAQVCKMVDAFMEAGFNYFDTAHGYIKEKSEVAVRKCLTQRYHRDRYVLTDKLSQGYFEKQEDIRPLLLRQLEICGVDYFDFYLMHSQHKDSFAKFKKCRAYETALELKAEGLIKHLGISFHDQAPVLDQILTEYPQVEVVQLQFNYADYEDVVVQGRKCYEVCLKHNKPVIVMEPVKGGRLVNLPEDAKRVFDGLKGGSYASYALRYAAGFENVCMVLSGMSNMEQMLDNISVMKDCKPLDEREQAAMEQARDIIYRQDLIPCTSCYYCTDGCPQQILIPELFGCLNAKKQHKEEESARDYHEVHTVNNGKASACVQCGACEQACPQHLSIRRLLKRVALEFGG